MNTALIQVTTDGDSVVLAGVAGKRIRVLAYTISSSTNAAVVWKSDSTAISGAMHMATNSNIAIHLGDAWPSGGLPVLQTATGEGLSINVTSGGSNVIGGHLTYVMVSV